MPDPGGDPDAEAVESGGSGRRADADAEDNGSSGTHHEDSGSGADRDDNGGRGTHPSDSNTRPLQDAATESERDSSDGLETVLVVEDEEPLARLYRDWLAETYDVRVANTGREALEQLEKAVDVVLLDRRLPGISGHEVLKQVRASGAGYQVAMVTAVEPDVDVLEMGFDDYVTKPIERDELRSLVASLVSRNQYSGYVQRYFRLLSKRAAIEREFDGDLSDCPEYQSLLEEITTVEADLGALVEEFTTRDFDAQFYWFSDGNAAVGD
jgi:DNA-binding response OmpR family regulator